MTRKNFPDHLRDAYFPHRESVPGRVLEWFAMHAQDAWLSVDGIAGNARFHRTGCTAPVNVVNNKMRKVLAEGYLVRDTRGPFMRGPAWNTYMLLRSCQSTDVQLRDAPAHSPPANSWGRVVCEFFRANPDEELTLEDVALKFGNPHVRAPLNETRANVLLGRVCREGYLRRRGDSYFAGPNINKLPALPLAA